jgi:mRNA-degrading endonuclease toxin of MazEF toxin-antitoxin module
MKEELKKTKQFDIWNVKKKNMDNLEIVPEFHEREIWFVSLGLNVGFEEDGKGEDFLRPILILRKFNKQIFYGLPLTSTIKENSKFYFILKNHELKTGSAILSQMRLIDAKRLSYRIGAVGEDEFKQLKEKLRELLVL